MIRKILIFIGIVAVLPFSPQILKSLTRNYGIPQDYRQKTLETRRQQMSVSVLNTGSYGICDGKGKTKSREYFEQLLSQGWSVSSSETNNYSQLYDGGFRPENCSVTYYILEK